MDDTRCPWCGEQLYNPFSGEETTERDYDVSIEAHYPECEKAEQ